MGSAIFAIFALVIPFLVSNLLQVLWFNFYQPYSLTRRFKKQGITGPHNKLLAGSLNKIKRMKKDTREIILDTDSNDVVQKVLPHHHRWPSGYGTLPYWHGTEPHLFISDPKLAKQIPSNKFGCYVKP
ncbi:hypothetical protein SLA2020_024210 [Shorea laevis]